MLRLLLAAALLILPARAADATAIEQVLDAYRNGQEFPEGWCDTQGDACTQVLEIEYHPQLEGFDPALGELQRVELVLSATWYIETEYTRRESWFSPRYWIRTGFDAYDPGGWASVSGSARFEDTSCDAATVGTTCPVSWELVFEDRDETDNVARFIGAGTLPWDTLGGWLSYEQAYPSTGQTTPYGEGTLTVIYHYVPEPSTVLLLGMGVGVAAQRNRRPRTP